MADYESVLCVKNEVFVYRIPPRTSNRGYRAADWTLDKPDWTGRIRVVALGKQLFIKIEDKTSGELYAQCPVESYPGVEVEQVLDSSRYFVIRVVDPSGRKAFIGIGFADRGDSFDLIVAIQDHFKWVKREAEAQSSGADLLSNDSGPKLDLGLKEGQTIRINIGSKKEGGRTRPKATGGGLGFLPPPPGSKKTGGDVSGRIQPPLSGSGSSGTSVGLQNPTAPPTLGAPANTAQQTTSHPGASSNNSGFSLVDVNQPTQPATQQHQDQWGDFTSASSSSGGPSQPAAVNKDPWIQF